MKHTSIRLLLCVSSLVLVIFLYESAVYAQLIYPDLPDRDGFKIGVGRALVHLSGKAGVIFDDNIFLSEDDKKSDVITRLSPLIGIEIPVGKGMISADYEFSEYLYDKYEHEDHPDHRARGLVEINMTDYKITIDETYRRFTDRAAIENSARIREQTNNCRVGISTERDQLGFEVGYTNKINDYISNAIITDPMTYNDKDHMTHLIDLAVLYRFLPKTSFILETDVAFIEYDSDYNPDSYYIEPLVGLKGELTNKITANIRGGYRHNHIHRCSYRQCICFRRYADSKEYGNGRRVYC